MSRPRAYQLIDSANVIGNLSTMVDKPISERQARPLAKLPPEDQPKAWEAANETAKREGRKVTAADVEREVGVRKLTAKERKELMNLPPSIGLWQARRAIEELEKIEDNDTERQQALDMVKEWINNES